MAVIDTLGIAEDLAKDGVLTREQAERLARMSAKAATEGLATKADIGTIRSDMAALRTDLFDELERSIARTRTDLDSIVVNRREVEVQIQTAVKEVVKWVAGILLTHGIAVIGVTVTLVKLL